MNVTITLTRDEALTVIDLLNRHLPADIGIIAVFNRAVDHAEAEAALLAAKIEEEATRHAIDRLAFPADVRRRLAELTERFDRAQISAHHDRHTHLASAAVQINDFAKRVAQEIDSFTQGGFLTDEQAAELAQEVAALRRRALTEGLNIAPDRVDGLLR